MSGHAQKMVQVSAGWSVILAINWVFDNPVYLSVIAWKGLIIGGAIMTAASIVLNATTLGIYEWRKRNGVDHLGMDEFAALKKYLVSKTDLWKKYRGIKRVVFFFLGLGSKIASLFLSKGDVPAFLCLSVWSDPIVALAFWRRNRIGHFSLKDWLVFLASTLLANTYWSIRSFVIVLIPQIIWKWRDAILDLMWGWYNTLHILLDEAIRILFAFGCL